MFAKIYPATSDFSLLQADTTVAECLGLVTCCWRSHEASWVSPGAQDESRE